MYIKPEDTSYIIDPITTELFCYDSDNHGGPIIDGYHWKIVFYIGDEIVKEVEGWPREDKWRYGEIKRIIEFAERYVPKDLGSKYMNYYGDEPEDNGIW